MHPVLYQSDALTLNSYMIFFLLAWVVGGSVFYLEFRRLGWELEQMMFVMGGCIIGAAAGSYLFSVIFVGWAEIPAAIRAMDFSGKTILGGITGGFIAVEYTKKRIGYPHSTGDAFALAIPIGHAIGRVGCFLAGCCFGTRCHLPWAVIYPQGSMAHLSHINHGFLSATSMASLPVHPTPIYEIIFNLTLFGLFYIARDNFKVRGSMFRLYLVLYGSFRLLEEFIRDDSVMPETGIMKPVQWFLLIAVIYFGRSYYNNELRTDPE